MGAGYVYFVSFTDLIVRSLNPYVKIGISYDKDKRIGQIQTGSPLQLKYFGLIKHSEPKAVEKYLHKLFKNDRSVGEWFLISPAIINGIRTRYTLDIDCLDELLVSTKETPESLKIRELETEIKNLRKELIARDNYLNEFKKDYEICRMCISSE